MIEPSQPIPLENVVPKLGSNALACKVIVTLDKSKLTMRETLLILKMYVYVYFYSNLRTPLGDYSRPSHEGYRNTIELPEGNNVVLLRSDTIWLVQNRCSFHGLRSEDPNQHLKDFLKLVDSLDLDVTNREIMRLHLFQFSLCDHAKQLA
ncbi:hypothetical protein Tco_0627654 [Tanacetum coccineum]|uniref:MAK10-like protein n=1 Tax=Tanacetum coccineum TaxID=301880 RepID=A0ABQ4WN38_9ASTR